MFERFLACPRLRVSRPGALCAAALAATLSCTAPASAASTRRGVSHSHLGHAPARPLAKCANSDTTPVQASLDAMRAAVVCLVNEQRAARHLPGLHELRRLDQSAQLWTDTMVASSIFEHTTSSSDPGARISAAGYSWSSIGENIATGYPTPRQVVAAWMQSTGHCRNILAPDFTDVGTGVSLHGVARFAGGPATWTQDFGLPAGASAPSGDWGQAQSCPH